MMKLHDEPRAADRLPFLRSMRNFFATFRNLALSDAMFQQKLGLNQKLNGPNFVFADFESSKIETLRRLLRANLWQLTFIYSVVAVLWTVITSYGTALHSDNPILLNLTPHVAHFLIALGLFLYPRSLFWVPLLVLALVFPIPFFISSGKLVAWIDEPLISVDAIVVLFAINLITVLTLAGMMKFAFSCAMKRFRPQLADIIVGVVALVGVVCVNLLQGAVTVAYFHTMMPSVQDVVGLSSETAGHIFHRAVRGGAIMVAVMLAMVDVPSKLEFRLALLVVSIFILLGIAENRLIFLNPEVDALLLGLVFAVTVPVPTALQGNLLGMTVYAAMTGAFLHDDVGFGPEAPVLNFYATTLMVVLVIMLSIRSLRRHLIFSYMTGISRLDRIREFAGVGLISANMTQSTYKLDAAAAKVLNCPTSGPLLNIVARMQPSRQARLVAMLQRRSEYGDTIQLSMTAADGQNVIVDLFLWGETSPTGDQMAYGLFLDVTAEVVRSEELQSSLDSQRLQDAKQRQLFSIISHELRTPASVISMLVDQLPDEQKPSTKNRLRETSDHLLAVLGDMRQAVNPEQNLSISYAPYSPAQLAQSVLDNMVSLAAQSETQLSLAIEAGGEKLRMGDIVRNRQILSNLVRNALLHAGASVVEIGWSLSKDEEGRDRSIWSVRDDGRGISKLDEARLFEPFERGAKDARRRPDGSGLGLYVSRLAARTMGGDLVFTRPAEGGSLFTAYFREDAVIEIPADPSSEAAALSAIKNLRLLVAEDNDIVAEVMMARLTKEFAHVERVQNGQQMVDRLTVEAFDVVISDLFMPEMDGDAATKIVRTDGYTGIIVGLTAAALGEEAGRFTSAGADVVLFKPLAIKDLLTAIEMATKARHSLST